MTLQTEITEISRLSLVEKKALKKLGLHTVEDLLFYFPHRYSHISEVAQVDSLSKDEYVTVLGTLTGLKMKKGFKTTALRAEAYINDLSEKKIKLVWFHQHYIAKMLTEGMLIKVTGKVSENKSGLFIANPEFKKIDQLPIDSSGSLFEEAGEQNTEFGYPIYRETRGITSKWIYHTIQKIIKSGVVESIEEYIPEEIMKRYHLPKIGSALVWIHIPKNENHASAARKRFSFEEIFLIQLSHKRDRAMADTKKAYVVNRNEKETQEFVSRFPFTPTKGQLTAIEHIISDIGGAHPMSRLLEGDVGSGKTAVAATATFATVHNRPGNGSFGNLQVAYMAPTEILATQLFENFITYFAHMPIQIGLITSSGCRKFPSKILKNGLPTWTTISRTQLLKWVANGEIPILIGTHSLIQKSVTFKHLALVIIDEQHRFGTKQRAHLAKKEGFLPHFLSMTATPIPRTLALTMYGDLDLTVLDELPAGRKKVITTVVYGEKRKDTYEEIRVQLKAGRQLYVICPRIDEDEEKSILKAVTSEAKRLKNEVFNEYTIGIVHSKMTPAKKEEVMLKFSSGEIQILVATSVVEVGVNVPNATVIIIEGAERFGLAQLHQLRGRVLRSSHQAYCYVFADTSTKKTVDRLQAFVTAKNGFELAELDFSLRGAGELSGFKQWGISDLGMEAIKNIKIVEAARNEAIQIIKHDSNLNTYPLLKKLLDTKNIFTHFE